MAAIDSTTSGATSSCPADESTTRGIFPAAYPAKSRKRQRSPHVLRTAGVREFARQLDMAVANSFRAAHEVPPGVGRFVGDAPVVGDVILNHPEALWLKACLAASDGW